MKRIKNKLKQYDKNITIKKRLYVSNTVMFLVPVFITIMAVSFFLGTAFYIFFKHYLPDLNIDIEALKSIKDNDFRSLDAYGHIIGYLFLAMLAVIFLAMIFTNFFLTRFVIRRVSDPLTLITEGVDRIKDGNLDLHIDYNRNDEFRQVVDAINLMTDKLRESAERAQNEEQSRRELYAGISHDLRSPLTSVRAYTEALLEGVAKTPEDEQKYLMKIHNRELDIERMVEQIFLFSKMEMKDFPLYLQQVNLKDEFLRIATENPMDHICVSLDHVQPYSVEADSSLFQRVVINLLENSAKYRKNDIANVVIRTEADDEFIHILFEDDGPGVSAEYLPKLFDAFYRTDPARKNPSGGSGLGLAVVKKIILRMGGNVEARINASGGLTIIISLKNISNGKCRKQI